MIDDWGRGLPTGEVRGLIQRELRRMCVRGPEADDLEQAIWLKLLLDWAKIQLMYDPRVGPWDAWLVTIVRRTAIDAARRLGRRRNRQISQRELELVIDDSSDPASALESRERREAVDDALTILKSRVSPVNFAILERSLVEEQSPAEIAAALGVSPSSTRTRLKKIKANLRSLLLESPRLADDSGIQQLLNRPKKSGGGGGSESVGANRILQIEGSELDSVVRSAPLTRHVG